MTETSRGAVDDVLCERDVPVAMRDGTVLRCDVWRPRSGEKVPALLQRQPYDKRMAQAYVYAHPAWYARHGYAVVVEDSRGRGSSEGTFYPLRGDANDGFDTIAWCAAQPWCSGKVASFGFSIPGLNQLLAAAARPSALVAAVPAFYPQGMYDGLVHVGGAFGLAAVLNWSQLLAPDAARRAGRLDLLDDIRNAAGCGGPPPTLALKDMPFLMKPDLMPFLRDYLEHPAFGAYWQEFELGDRLSQISVPCLHLSGWYDTFVNQTLDAYRRFTSETRAEHRLLIGPWYHIPWTQQVGVVDFGDAARNVVDEYQLAWFDAWTKGRREALDAIPPVRVFVTGSNSWHDAESWPLPGVTTQSWYLRSGGRANSLNGNGFVSLEKPRESEPADYFFYDPAAPVQSLGGHSCCYPQATPMGPSIQRDVELRNDVLVYSSEPLEQPVWVAGTVTARLFAATSARDTDWVVKLCDVAPDGRSLNIQEGVIRARFRNGFGQATLLEPDSVVEYTITVGACCHRFAAGHRIRIQVTSSNFPAIDRNPNTGGPLGMEGPFEWEPASQTVFHDGARPSCVFLPVVPH
jgi:putative CocE/NonD family hydrolase